MPGLIWSRMPRVLVCSAADDQSAAHQVLARCVQAVRVLTMLFGDLPREIPGDLAVDEHCYTCSVGLGASATRRNFSWNLLAPTTVMISALPRPQFIVR